MKQKIAVTAAAVLCASLFVRGTTAYHTAEITTHNVVTTGGIRIELLEWADSGRTEPFPDGGMTDIFPGRTVTKIAEVRNISDGTGDTLAYIRIRADVKVNLADGSEGNPGIAVIDYNQADWELIGGFWYYRSALQKGETTSPLFTSVSFREDAGNEYQGSRVTVSLTAFATQAAHNGDTAAEAKGWPSA